MRGRVIVVALAAAVVIAAAAAVAFVATSSDGTRGETSAASSSFAGLSQESGEVTVKATLRQLSSEGAVAEVVFDTHSVELDLDIVAAATLTVAGVTWPTESWDGDGPTGHHREGKLRFSAAGPPQGTATLTIEGLSEPVTFRWPIP